MSDRVILEQACARELYATWQATQEKVLTTTRIAWLNKVYGRGAADRVREYMGQMKNGEMV
jgi:hypothetical protein